MREVGQSYCAFCQITLLEFFFTKSHYISCQHTPIRTQPFLVFLTQQRTLLAPSSILFYQVSSINFIQTPYLRLPPKLLSVSGQQSTSTWQSRTIHLTTNSLSVVWIAGILMDVNTRYDHPP